MDWGLLEKLGGLFRDVDMPHSYDPSAYLVYEEESEMTQDEIKAIRDYFADMNVSDLAEVEKGLLNALSVIEAQKQEIAEKDLQMKQQMEQYQVDRKAFAAECERQVEEIAELRRVVVDLSAIKNMSEHKDRVEYHADTIAKAREALKHGELAATRSYGA